MKIAMFFRPAGGRRPGRTQKPQSLELVQDWTVRDWADLPPHHPRRS